MRNNLPLPRMFPPVPRVKQPPPNTNESVVEIGFGEPRAVPVDDGDGGGGGDGDVVGGEAEEFACSNTGSSGAQSRR